eukprot:TRINITY_DN151937_c2_g1_i1.p1 TRINITY_DN151937_c2_g1~~TRINITY_DN151937_c2_g1_i1.p1  ORF type:complete len:189 (-),score=32.25 TRINITY_DN151937_c2_g1_i1:175-741(-)
MSSLSSEILKKPDESSLLNGGNEDKSEKAKLLDSQQQEQVIRNHEQKLKNFQRKLRICGLILMLVFGMLLVGVSVHFKLYNNGTEMIHQSLQAVSLCLGSFAIMKSSNWRFKISCKTVLLVAGLIASIPAVVAAIWAYHHSSLNSTRTLAIGLPLLLLFWRHIFVQSELYAKQLLDLQKMKYKGFETA